MVAMTGAAIWLGGGAVSQRRWLGRPYAIARPQPSRVQRVVACVLAALYAYLLVDWLLHQ
jgi:hypothetical protein